MGLPSWGAVGLDQYATGSLLKMAEGRKTRSGPLLELLCRRRNPRQRFQSSLCLTAVDAFAGHFDAVFQGRSFVGDNQCSRCIQQYGVTVGPLCTVQQIHQGNRVFLRRSTNDIAKAVNGQARILGVDLAGSDFAVFKRSYSRWTADCDFVCAVAAVDKPGFFSSKLLECFSHRVDQVRGKRTGQLTFNACRISQWSQYVELR